jgi:hypothetical protein
MKKMMLALCATGAIALASPASAANTVTDLHNCVTSAVTPTANACAGYYTSNLLSNSPADIADQTSALSSIGYTFDGNFNSLTSGTLTGNVLSFGNLMLGGSTVIGIHYGDAGTGLGDRTVFYSWNNLPSTSGITLSLTQGFSNAVLYRSTGAVPEPATWAMMLLGFGAIGVSMRRRKPVLAQIA